ncbi:MAG: hypothetical protein R3Y24_08580 [Eubacteriales bacterium]
MSKTKHIMIAQFKILGKDSLMLFLLIYPIILTIVGRLCIPMITESLLPTFDFSLHYGALMAFFVVMNPIVFGAIMGLSILDERESNVIHAIQVLPMNFSQYILAKSILFTVLSIISGMIITDLVNLYDVPLLMSFFINLVSSCGVFFGMVIINLFATNKVEGFATMKMTGFLLIIPVVGMYLAKPFSYLCALAPAYWPTMVLASYSKQNIGEINAILFLVIGFLYINILSYFMYRLFMKKIK